jgi:hypothetical protein
MKAISRQRSFVLVQPFAFITTFSDDVLEKYEAVTYPKSVPSFPIPYDNNVYRSGAYIGEQASQY